MSDLEQRIEELEAENRELWLKLEALKSLFNALLMDVQKLNKAYRKLTGTGQLKEK